MPERSRGNHPVVCSIWTSAMGAKMRVGIAGGPRAGLVHPAAFSGIGIAVHLGRMMRTGPCSYNRANPVWWW